AYESCLDRQVQQGEEVLSEQLEQDNSFVQSVAEQLKEQYAAEVDFRTKEQLLRLRQRYSEQLQSLRQAAHRERAALSLQANALATEHSRRQAQDDINQIRYEMAQKLHPSRLPRR
ncbi:unnamed protein product, partial [Prorocentrum cordatum]